MTTQTHTNGTTQNGTIPQIDMQTWRDAVAMMTQRAADHYGPELAGRVTKAGRIVLDGLIQPEDNGAEVASESDPETTHHVTREGCECPDARTKAPEGKCKHFLAWQIYRGACGAAPGLAKQREPESKPESASEPEASESTVRIPPQFITQLHGRDFVTFPGLLAVAHESGLVSLDSQFLTVGGELATAIATAKFEDGRTFTECGDATPQNVGKNIAPHFARMALTRAKARALRDALNIGMCSVEELAE